MADEQGNNPTNTPNPLTSDADRDFDREPDDQTAAPASPEELAAEEAAEAAAQANADRARQRLLSERAMRDAMSPQPAAPGAPVPAPEPQAPFAPKRGKQRWPVKTINDEDIDKVSFSNTSASFPDDENISETTVENLWLEERPADMPLTKAVKKYQANRAPGTETTIWQIEGRIISHKWEKDGDLHLVLQDLESGYTMVIESPQTGDGSDDLPFVDAKCPEQVKERIQEARRLFEEELDPKPFFKNSTRQVTVRGVGFFDILHGATGAAETNSIELHPILDVRFSD